MSRRIISPNLNARVALILAFSAVLLSHASAQAAPRGPSLLRRAAANPPEFTWLLTSREDNQVLCVIVVGHEGRPTPSEVTRACGVDLATRLQDTPECRPDAVQEVACTGLSLRLQGSQAAEDPEQFSLIPDQLRLELMGCERTAEAWTCLGTPILKFVGDEGGSSDPLTSIYIVVDGRQAGCPASTCEVPLPPTEEEGIEVAFRFTTASGVTSPPEAARVRVSALAAGETGGPLWQVNVLSTRLIDDRMDRCGLVWDSLPPLQDRPAWLALADNPEALRTNEPYALLEERLESLGFLSGSPMENRGIVSASDAAGPETDTESLVGIWQNQFDGAILEASSARGLPAHMMKSLFAHESQFWPGSFPEVGEVGLGHMSSLGADNLLLWSPTFYAQFCPQVLHPDTCSLPYSSLPEDQKALLRSALLASVNADCADCSPSLDLDEARRSVSVFAESLVAYCSQTGRMVFNATRATPGLVSTYEDLWRFTLADYNAGSGCLAQALTKTSRQRQPLDWSHVSSNLLGECQIATEYVAKILAETTVETEGDVEETAILVTADSVASLPEGEQTGR